MLAEDAASLSRLVHDENEGYTLQLVIPDEQASALTDDDVAQFGQQMSTASSLDQLRVEITNIDFERINDLVWPQE